MTQPNKFLIENKKLYQSVVVNKTGDTSYDSNTLDALIAFHQHHVLLINT